ncbi:U11/U12 small nuclear ribonucleoprotein 48 kDa protein-like [Ceratina calcarata]|uniref:U11/U12 small nuclear ribonucleoprotein 48 kDa protein-like n=1 Tax=Ceratina calcarata TaxID=156304 RepID=A0AAJ7NDU1_9HYME|nr:U11/U12 small nuclear ribonucleoprotein 48 kDa protein-like [Ceratina calcarata]
MSNPPINQREKQYKDLDNFTKKIHQELMDITSTLGWTIENTEILSDNRLVCPYDSSHQVGKKTLDQHLESCQWKQEGYSEFDTPLPESSLPLDSYSSIRLNSKLQNGILQEEKKKDPTLRIGLGERLIPRTSNRIFTDFTCDERRVLYDYAISNTVKPDIGHDDITDIQQSKNDGNKDDKKLSFIEVLIQERNLKRRRAKHRGVHTNKKSHTEILREVIHQQMELYTDYVTDTRLPNSLDHRESSSSHNNEKYDEFDKTYDCSEKDSEEREKSSRSTSKSHRTQKHHKHKRSRSRERKHRDRKSEHGSMRSHHKRKHVKSNDYEESYHSNVYIKHKREKLI